MGGRRFPTEACNFILFTIKNLGEPIHLYVDSFGKLDLVKVALILWWTKYNNGTAPGGPISVQIKI